MLVGIQLGIFGGGRFQRLNVRKSQLLRDGQKLLLVLLDLIDADLVNLLRRQIGGGALLYQKAIISFAIRQRPYAWIVAAIGNVLSLQKLAEAEVSRIYLAGDGREQLLFDARLFGRRNRGWKLFERQCERAVLRLLIGDGIDLRQHFFHQVRGWLAVVIHADGHIVRGLLKGERNFLEASDVIVVVLHRVEAQLRNELGKIDLQAIELIDRHLPWLEPGFLLILDQCSDQQIFAQLLLISHPSRIHLGQSAEKGSTAGQGFVVCLHGVVGELIVVPVISDGGGKVGLVLEVIFPVVGEDGVERFYPGVKGKILCRANGACKRDQDHKGGDKGWYS